MDVYFNAQMLSNIPREEYISLRKVDIPLTVLVNYGILIGAATSVVDKKKCICTGHKVSSFRSLLTVLTLNNTCFISGMN